MRRAGGDHQAQLAAGVVHDGQRLAVAHVGGLERQRRERRDRALAAAVDHRHGAQHVEAQLPLDQLGEPRGLAAAIALAEGGVQHSAANGIAAACVVYQIAPAAHLREHAAAAHKGRCARARDDHHAVARAHAGVQAV